MILSRANLNRIGWAMILTICGAALLALTFKVNSVKSKVRLAERQLIAAQQEKDLLETEFETRANQHHLAAINQTEFGYAAPAPGQYLEGERQLAALGKPRAVNAPSPIMVASADKREAGSAGFALMVNPLTGKTEAAEPARAPVRKVADAAGLASRLAQVGQPAKAKKVAASE